MAPTVLPASLRANFRNLYADIFWFGVLAGSSLAFVAIYAARLGATSFQISLLTAGPAVVNLVFSLPVGRWLQNQPLLRVVLRSSLWQRLGYLAFIFLPLSASFARQIWVLVLITVIISLPGAILAISFNAAFADLVPPEWRGVVVGRRNALLAFSMVSTSLLCGQLLDRVGFPLNYQLVFALGAGGAVLSSYHLSRLRPPAGSTAAPGVIAGDQPRPEGERGHRPFRLRFRGASAGAPLLRLDLLRSTYGTFLLACLIFYTFQFFSIPLYPVFNVNVLRLSDGQISLGSALFYTTMMLASFGLGAMSARLGHRGVLITGALLFGLYPLLIGLAQDATLFWLASMAGGAAWGITNGGLMSRLMERTPEDDRPAYMALHNLSLNLGILLGSLSGPLLSGHVGLRTAILIGAALRFTAGFVFILWG